jgi:hypothetical protein
MKPRRRVLLLLIFLAASGISAPEALGEATNADGFIDVKKMGAAGDGAADDTGPLQAAFDCLGQRGGEILLPPGTYRVTKTLRIERRSSGVVRGLGGAPFGRGKTAGSTILWDGAKGGTLIDATMACFSFHDLNLDGGGLATVLFQFRSELGWGNLLSKFENVHLANADTGFQVASAESDAGNADYTFAFVTFTQLKTAFRVNNNQGVDYLFNHIFALNCGTVLDFERGGNLHVNNAQLTNCRLFLAVRGGGRNAGTYLCNMVRMEADGGGETSRSQLLKTSPANRQAVIKFTGFNDCQWKWTENRTGSRALPLCEIGPGASVVIESSVFNSPVARLDGEARAPASLILRGCSFGYIEPRSAVSANPHGFFKMLDNFDDKMRLLDDVFKWPAQALGGPDNSPKSKSGR